LRLLGEVGYGGLTIDALAQAAGVGKATIYRRWRTKQDLIVESISDLGSLLTVPPDTGSLREDLRQFMHLLAETTRSRSAPCCDPCCRRCTTIPSSALPTAPDR
jgi:AcrR family transcriptional regulator